MITPTLTDPSIEDPAFETTLRPQRLSDFVGQTALKDKLSIFITAAKQRGDALDHALFCGPPGLGKTTLAHIMASELQRPIQITSGPSLERAGDLAAVLTNLESHQILFVDEIHRLPRVVEEILYPAMEDYRLDIIVGQGPGARTVRLDLPPFTLVGATTRAGLLTSPLRDRFGIAHRLDFYTSDDLAQILTRSAQILCIDLEPHAAMELARRARGTPRIANRLLHRVRDFAQVKADGRITHSVAMAALELLAVDQAGFDEMDRKILRTIIDQFSGGPVGVESIAAAVSEERNTIEDVYEPFLIQAGYLARTARGRMVTSKTFTHFGIAVPSADDQEPLFS